MKVILASASPRRKELLGYIYKSFDIIPSGAEEIIPTDLPIEQAPAYLSAIKADDIAQKYPDALVIGADTGVLIEGKMLGKPKDRNDAHQMIASLSGKTHHVITGVTLQYGKMSHTFSVKSAVTFYPMSDREIEQYVATPEPYDKAGGYGIQGNGMLLVEKIEGDYNNIVGLPVAQLKREIDLFLKQI